MKISVPHGELVELRCKGQGQPLPEVDLLFGVLPAELTEPRSPGEVATEVVVTTDTVGKYSCVASSTYVPPEGGARPSHHHRTYELSISGEFFS